MVIDQVHLTDSGVYTCTIYTGILLTCFINLTQTPIRHQMASIDIKQYFLGAVAPLGLAMSLSWSAFLKYGL